MKLKLYLVPETDWMSAVESDLLAASLSDGQPIVGPQSIEDDFFTIGGQYYE